MMRRGAAAIPDGREARAATPDKARRGIEDATPAVAGVAVGAVAGIATVARSPALRWGRGHQHCDGGIVAGVVTVLSPALRRWRCRQKLRCVPVTVTP